MVIVVTDYGGNMKGSDKKYIDLDFWNPVFQKMGLLLDRISAFKGAFGTGLRKFYFKPDLYRKLGFKGAFCKKIEFLVRFEKNFIPSLIFQ